VTRLMELRALGLSPVRTVLRGVADRWLSGVVALEESVKAGAAYAEKTCGAHAIAIA
jgi:hypothetical protein